MNLVIAKLSHMEDRVMGKIDKITEFMKSDRTLDS